MKWSRRFVLMALPAALCVLLCFSGAWGLDGREHAKLWDDVFGIADAASREKVRRLWDVAQMVIDDKRIVYEGDMNEKIFNRKIFTPDEINFGWLEGRGFGGAKHRYLFHWGFNASPDEHREALEESVDEALEDYVRKTEMPPKSADVFISEEKQKFFDYILDVQEDQNRLLIDEVEEVLGITTRRYASALASIIHDVHLLGDYYTSSTGGLPPLRSIRNDMVHKGFKKLFWGGDYTEKIQRIEAAFDEAIDRADEKLTKKDQAEALLAAAKRYLPAILNDGKFKSSLAAKGIVITEPGGEENGD